MKKSRQPSKIIGLNGKSLVNEKQKASKYPALADMMMLPRLYRRIRKHFEIGDEDKEPEYYFEPIDPKNDPSKDAIIQIIGKAYPQIVDFVKEVDELKLSYNGAATTVAAMHKAAMGKEIAPVKGIVEDVESLRLRCAKALDVLKGIAFSAEQASAEQLRFRARQFIEDNERISLVNEKGSK